MVDGFRGTGDAAGYVDDPSQSRAARGLLDWSQQELAGRSNLSESTIRDLRRGAVSRPSTISLPCAPPSNLRASSSSPGTAAAPV
ncbi:hypothetical protein AJ88_26300 [Mesorhizobium amorphae CCBAU 01583]|nr:hypothetical protein AJ88_26300 [Mesorhizobium amorphae CCBAU 01583]